MVSKILLQMVLKSEGKVVTFLRIVTFIVSGYLPGVGVRLCVGSITAMTGLDRL